MHQKPVTIRKLQGNPRQKPIPDNLPNNQGLQYPCPDFLLPHAREFYEHTLSVWGKNDVIQEQDYRALLVASNDWQEYMDLTDDIKANGYVYEIETREGGVAKRPNPSVAMRSDCNRRVMKFLCEFGMTPASLIKVHAKNAKQGESDLDQIAKVRAEKRAKLEARESSKKQKTG
jgi:P27 family predicted phage terminase small subunit